MARAGRARPVAWLRRLGVAAAALEVVYLLAGNACLRTDRGRELFQGRGGKLSVSWRSAWTSLPGLVHVKGLALGGRTRRVEWHATAGRGHAWFWLPSLAARHVRVLSGAARGVEIDVEPLVHLAGTSPPPRRRGWRVTLGGFRVEDLRRLRVAGYELAGAGEVEGWARFEGHGPMSLRLARLAFHRAVLESGDRAVARRLDLDARLATEPFVVGTDDVRKLLAGASGALRLKAQADNLDFLSAYLRKVPWLVLGGTGDLALEAKLEHGVLLPGSTLGLTGPQVEARFFDFRARGRGRIEGKVDATGRGVHLGAVLSEFSLARRSDGAPILAGRDLETGVRVPSAAVAEPPAGVTGWLRLPSARVPDVAVFDRYLPPALQLRVDGGTADLSADLSYDTAAGAGAGWLAIEGRHVTGAFGDALFSTDVALRVEAPKLDLLAGRFDLAGSSLRLDATRLERRGRFRFRSEGWSGRVRVPEGRILMEPVRGTEAPKPRRTVSMEAEVEAQMRDSAPVLVLLEQRLPALAWLDRLLDIHDVELKGRVSARGRDLGLHAMDLTGGSEGQLEIQTELDLAGKSTSGVAYVRYRGLDAVLALDRGDRRWGVVKARERYRDAVREYLAGRGASDGSAP